MTKVQLHYELLRPLDGSDTEGVANAHSVYGIMRVWVAPALDRLTVDYDASRLSEPDVEAALIQNGLPLKRESVEAAG